LSAGAQGPFSKNGNRPYTFERYRQAARLLVEITFMALGGGSWSVSGSPI